VSWPDPSNWGSQNRFRFGSFQTMKSRTVGRSVASVAVKSANWRCWSAVSGAWRALAAYTDR